VARRLGRDRLRRLAARRRRAQAPGGLAHRRAAVRGVLRLDRAAARLEPAGGTGRSRPASPPRRSPPRRSARRSASSSCAGWP
jgi:hypothetical protein